MNRYIDKIELAISFIHENLAESINWPDIAKECGISQFHFHRIFSSYLGETPRDYLIRKRLEKAIAHLAYPTTEVNLAQLALDCGYSSQANFSKAFKNYFGVTPGDVLNDKEVKNSKIGKIKSKYGKEFHLNQLYPSKEFKKSLQRKEVEVKAVIKEMPERTIAYLTSQRGYEKDAIHQTWTTLMEKASVLGKNLEAVEKYGIGHDNPQVTPMEKCRYDACLLLEEEEQVPPSLNSSRIPAGKYACFHFKGNGEKLIQFYLEIYKNWFSENGYEPGDFPLVEKYIYVNKDDLNADIELETQFLLK